MSSHPIIEELRKTLRQLPYLPQALALVWAAARRWTVAWAMLLVLQGLLPVATVYLTRAIVDSLVNVTQSDINGTASYGQTLFPVALMAAVLVLTELLRSITMWVRTAQAELVQDHISRLLHTQAMTLDMAHYEHPAFYDQLHRARVDAASRPLALLENVGTLLQNGLTFVAMAGILFSFGWWLPPLLFLTALPALAVILRHTIRENRWRLRITKDRRRSGYYDRLLTDREAVAEVRLFALGPYFQKAYREIRARLRQERIQLTRAQGLSELAAGGMALLTMGGVLAWMLWQTVQGLFNLGDLAMFYQAFNQGQRLTRTLMGSARQIYSNMLFLENLFTFLLLKPTVCDPPSPIPLPAKLQQGIRFEGVSFAYPESQRLALEEFNLELPAGQIVAIVGENGAGKSTLVKLLCRFYDPTAGRILLDGIDLRDLAQAELRRHITILFQRPMNYHVTAQENIALGDIHANPTQEEVGTAAQAAGADTPIHRLSEGYETMLGKWFGGAELSGGEWQRLALARAFLRQAEIVVLDEPTSAMDSWAEADWMARFRTLVKERTTLMITHRFTTAMHADMIYVMVEGRIVESGTHEGLLAQEGRYADSWRRQQFRGDGC